MKSTLDRQRFLCCAAFAILYLLVSTASQAEQIFEVEVTGSALNLRSEPSGAAQILTKVPRGTRLTVIGESGDWFKVATAVSPAWVSKRYVRAIAVVSSPTAGGAVSQSSLWTALAIGLLVGPAIISLLIWRTGNEKTILQVDRLDRWIVANHERANLTTSRGLRKYWARPVFGIAQALSSWTERIEQPALRASVRFTAYSYAATLVIIGTLILAYAAIIAVLVIVALIIMLWVMGKVLSSESESGHSGAHHPQPRQRSRVPLPQMVREGGSSRATSGAFRGDYVEHLARDGTLLGRSFEREGLTSEYIEHQDPDGSFAGRSYRRSSITGQEYFEHVDRHGNDVGSSHTVEGFFGDRLEHRDSHGDVVGESRGPSAGSHSEHSTRD